MTKLALIAGISGQDGYYLSKLLLKKNYKIIGLTRRQIKIKDIQIIRTKYTYKELLKIIKKFRPGIIYNLAGESNPKKSWHSIIETKDSIINLNLHFLEIIRRFSKKTKYFNCSSAEIYGLKNKKIKENDSISPNNPYGCFKSTTHLLTRIYREKYQIYAVNGVLFNHDSVKRAKGFLIKEIIEYCESYKEGQKRKLKLIDPNPIRDFAHAIDVVNAIFKIMNLKKPDDFIISGGTIRDVQSVALGFFKEYGIPKKNLVFFKKKKKTSDIKIGNSNKLKKRTNWNPMFKNKELFNKLIEENKI